MKEDQTKEDQMKQDETLNQWFRFPNDRGWARCPICNDVWNTWIFRYPLYAVWHHCGLPPDGRPGTISEQLCPIHAKEIIVDGRAKGQRIILNQDQLNEMTENGLHCPVCGRRTLKLIHSRPNSWTCRRCRASVVTDQVATSDGGMEIKYCSFREDLGKRKPEKLPRRELGWIDKGATVINRM
jgi:ribosomal protein L37AE/L43A